MTSRVVPLAVLLACVLGCDGASNLPTGRVLDDAGCQIGCDRCAPLAWCVSAPYQPACLATCSGPGSCGSGVCAVVDDPTLGDEPPQPVCVTRGMVQQCRSISCAIEPRCWDAQILLRPLAFKDQICGWEMVRCDSGCDATTAQCK